LGALGAGVLGKIDPVETFVSEPAHYALTVVRTAIAYNPGFKICKGLVAQTDQPAFQCVLYAAVITVTAGMATRRIHPQMQTGSDRSSAEDDTCPDQHWS